VRLWFLLAAPLEYTAFTDANRHHGRPRESGRHTLLLTKDKHAFYERFGFQAEREMAMILRR